MSAPKLPLLVRKKIKDDFEGNKEKMTQNYKDLFGVEYKFEADFPALYAESDQSQQERLGTIVYEAMDDCYKVIKSNTNDGEDTFMIAGFNEAVSKQTITVVIDPEFKGSYCGCRVNDGVFEIVFKPKGLGTNSYSACEYWKKAVNEASAKANPKGLPPTAKAGIKKDFEEKKAELEEKMSEELGEEKLTIHADFEDIWAKIVTAREGLPKNKKDNLDLDNLARKLGDFTFEYFKSLLDKIKRELKGDDMMIEGFFDEVTSKEAWFGLIEESEKLKGSYTDTSIEDGKLWSKAKATTYAINVDTGFEGLSKLL